MKKTKKRVLGLLGLTLVAITTIFAAFLPGPGASAEGGITTVTDTISVRVVGSQPAVRIIGLDEKEVVYPDQPFSVEYENIYDASVTLTYTNQEGETTTYDLGGFVPDYNNGEPKEYPLDLSDYGYGYYLVKVVGNGFGADNIAEDLKAFTYYPVTGEASEDESDGLVYLHLHYDTENENISTIGINIYDESGNLVGVISPITVNSPDTKVELPFSENDLATGNYRIEITAYDPTGVALYKPYITYYYYETIPVPDTGGLFKNLNISRADYVITGVLIFLSAAVLGIIFVAKGKNNKKRAAVKRRR